MARERTEEQKAKGSRALDMMPREVYMDSILGYRFPDSMIFICPHPAMIKKYGSLVSGKVYCSIYTCKKCKYHTEMPMCGAIGCGYENSKETK